MEFLFGIVLLGLCIWAIVNVVQSTASTLGKVLWVLLILFAPVIGFIIWLIVGPRSLERRPA
ncbi:MAG: PLDc N-terminal domain-containing protein [Alphaproteobacteria bacterium]